MESALKSKSPGNSFEIDGPQFNPELYLQHLLKEHTLEEIMDKGERIVHDTQQLHSEMQTLVYENYNKFISATDTIKKMKSDFKQMEAEMDSLAKNMESITSFSDQISSTLQDTRQQISKLSGIHSLLRNLQFLFKLPNKLKSLLAEHNYAQAVQEYLHTQQVLNHNAHLESFRGIQTDCLKIIQELKDQLRGQFKSKEATAKELTESVELLLLLGEPAENLYIEILTHASKRLSEQLGILQTDTAGQDMIEFVDFVNSGFLSDLCLVVTSYNELFVNPSQERECSESATEKLNIFVEEQMTELMECVEKRVVQEQEKCDVELMVRALDRFYSTLNALASLFQHSNFSKQGVEVMVRACQWQCEKQRVEVEHNVEELVRNVRQQSVSTGPQNDHSPQLLASLVLTTVDKIKSSLHDLTVFVQPELCFSGNRAYLERVSVDCVRRTLVMTLFDYIVQLATSFTKASTIPALPTLLVLAKMCLEFESTHINYVLGLVEQWFILPENKGFTKEKQEMCEQMHLAAQELVNHYVRMEGNIISQMLRKSVETRDWVRCLEPRTVRAVMKRVMEEMAGVESEVGSLFEEGNRAERSLSDSSRRTQSRQHRSGAWSSHIHKIFLERIEIFAPVHFSKVSILTGIIKISLKTLLECIRLRTFNKFGLQQIQVDTHYLQLYLWRYVSDENLVHLMLDEILGSAVHRCMQPALMEPSVVEIICERG